MKLPKQIRDNGNRVVPSHTFTQFYEGKQKATAMVATMDADIPALENYWRIPKYRLTTFNKIQAEADVLGLVAKIVRKH